MNGEVPSVYYRAFASAYSLVLLPYVAVYTGQKVKSVLFVLIVGSGWLSMSEHKVTKSQPSEFVANASSTHSSVVLFLMSTSYEELSCLIFFAIVAYVLSTAGFVHVLEVHMHRVQNIL